MKSKTLLIRAMKVLCPSLIHAKTCSSPKNVEDSNISLTNKN